MKPLTKHPVNEFGEIYYGPKTLGQAKQVIANCDWPWLEVAEQMEANGYAKEANKLRKLYSNKT